MVNSAWESFRGFRDNRRGVSLVELLVTLGLLAVIAAMIIPAVQSTRESARRMQCQSNLRQILLATHSFHNSEGTLPSLYNGTSLPRPLREWDLFHTHSWRVPLLPYLEQAALREQIVWDELATEPANTSVAQAVVTSYVCPTGSDPATNMGWGLRHAAILNSSDPIPEAAKYRVTRSDYDAMAGIQVLPARLPDDLRPRAVEYMRWGVWGWPRFDNGEIGGGRLIRYQEGRFRDVTDGLSNTLAVVERGGKPLEFNHGRPWVTKSNPNADYPGQVGWSASNIFIWAINQHGVGVNEINSAGIYSLHPGGANVSMADGSVKFLADSTDVETLIQMFSRSDHK